MSLIGILSPRILRLPHLARFLEPWGVPVPLGSAASRGEVAAIAGWGVGPEAERAQAAAQRRNLPYLSLVPGFLNPPRGFGGGALWSLGVDDLGQRDDATQTSRLEFLIGTGACPVAGVPALLQSILEHDLTALPGLQGGPSPTLHDDTRPIVLVIDDDRSESAPAMLEAAIAENPGDCLVVLGIAGKAAGRLAASARRRGIPYLAATGNPLPLVKRARRVYTVASLVGWDALLAGVPVSCFGLPFYAGWGLTDDRMTCSRRTARPPLETVIAAAYDGYSRYVDPVHARPTDALTIAGRLAALRRQAAENRGETVVFGISRWKRPFIRPFLASPEGSIHFAAASVPGVRGCAARGARLLVWPAREPDWLADEAAKSGIAYGRIEDGFLRSVGLGSDFIPALSLVVDDLGIYFDPTRESRLERILAETRFTPELVDQAALLRRLLVERRFSKYNIAAAATRHLDLPAGRRVVLVPGQVEDDASIRLGSPAIRTNLGLLEAARAAAPDAVVLYKPHPDVESGNRPGIVPEAAARNLADAVLSGWDAPSALDLADEVHTMTSLLGFEALLKGKRVATHGLPFYAGLGLTMDRLAWPRPRRPASLEALIAAAFLLYPRYRDPVHNLPVTAFDVIEILDRMRAQAAGRPMRTGRIGRWLALTLGRL